jgi:hypothetical protein
MQPDHSFWDPFGVFSDDTSSSLTKSPTPEEKKEEVARIKADFTKIEEKVSLLNKEKSKPVPNSKQQPPTAPKAVSDEEKREKIRELRKILRKYAKEAKRSSPLSKPRTPS